jgi:hypothetical protein
VTAIEWTGHAPVPAAVHTPAGLSLDGTAIVHVATGTPLALVVHRVDFLPVALARLADVDWLAPEALDTDATAATLFWAQRAVDGEVTAWLSEREQMAGRAACERGLCPFCLGPEHGPPGTPGCEMLEVDDAEAILGIAPSPPAPAGRVGGGR